MGVHWRSFPSRDGEGVEDKYGVAMEELAFSRRSQPQSPNDGGVEGGGGCGVLYWRRITGGVLRRNHRGLGKRGGGERGVSWRRIAARESRGT